MRDSFLHKELDMRIPVSGLGAEPSILSKHHSNDANFAILSILKVNVSEMALVDVRGKSATHNGCKGEKMDKTCLVKAAAMAQ